MTKPRTKRLYRRYRLAPLGSVRSTGSVTVAPSYKGRVPRLLIHAGGECLNTSDLRQLERIRNSIDEVIADHRRT